MKILSIRETAPIVVEEKSIRRVKVTFDENVSCYRWDKASQRNVIADADSIILPAAVFNAIMYNAHDKAAQIATGLISNGYIPWWNRACENAEVAIAVENDTENEYSSFTASNLVFSKDELTQKILHLGIYLNLGLVDRATKLRKEIEDDMLADIDDII